MQGSTLDARAENPPRPTSSAVALDASHDPALRSWVASARDHAEFPIQNLPFGAFSPEGEPARGGVAIGDEILDLAALAASGLCADIEEIVAAAAAPSLNGFLGLGTGARRQLRARLSALLAEGSPAQTALKPMLHPARKCVLGLPARIGDYTDFYAGIQHALNIGSLLRPDNPLLPNYKHIPIGYNGRASSVRPSGEPFLRPNGQRKRLDEAEPSFGPCRNLDYELELGIWIGPGNAQGSPVPIDEADDRIAGFCLLNDWSARDIQAWEYQPLGPFLSKGFATTISPWIVTPEALAPFRKTQAPRPEGDPAALPYLSPSDATASHALDITMEVFIETASMRANGLAPHRLSLGSTRDLYWTPAQFVAHHSSNGCNLEPGDLFGSGTISGRDPGSFGSLMEITRGGREPIALPNGESRTYLVDGDVIVMKASARREGFASIGFGECRAEVLPARG
ncbi:MULTISPECIES: fumarylacetoacetase [Bosea]|uniref:fumarylacetoacetase n=1 Tax=Bosea TaxID=85413 RepID=UPI00214FECBE|nr:MULTISPECIES: fumarylacetoacetase [Bosea]MCR4521696.1 fumarylacetoacetase [Bosea sp. 47.2.35]MDR6827218.1 fumarylacetoacetase [Bosea robiniae]MDR6893928.1 fumarylacetoacetase [Bosea sp. BE109]MDR7137323.1 fumarylacetoacetase [Bosea sp. BE168]MDR7174023.1 fumarylacetoacetase [Bosea sp. BE271]